MEFKTENALTEWDAFRTFCVNPSPEGSAILSGVRAAKLAAVKGPVADLLSKSAVNAALGWQFRPATQNGEAVPSEKVLEFLFRSSSR